jgi:hypothetical protein
VLALLAAPFDPNDVTATSLQRATEPVQAQLELRCARRSDVEFLSNRDCVLHLQPSPNRPLCRRATGPSNTGTGASIPSEAAPGRVILAEECARQAIVEVSGRSQIRSDWTLGETRRPTFVRSRFHHGEKWRQTVALCDVCPAFPGRATVACDARFSGALPLARRAAARRSSIQGPRRVRGRLPSRAVPSALAHTSSAGSEPE